LKWVKALVFKALRAVTFLGEGCDRLSGVDVAFGRCRPGLIKAALLLALAVLGKSMFR